MRARQRMIAGNVIMEQTAHEYSVLDLDQALDLLLRIYKGRNVLAETERALIRRALQTHDYQGDAAQALGISSRMITYHKKRLLAEQENGYGERWKVRRIEEGQT